MLVAIADVQIYKYCCSLERKHANELEHPTQAPNATSNGGDASRVGAFSSSLVSGAFSAASSPLERNALAQQFFTSHTSKLLVAECRGRQPCVIYKIGACERLPTIAHGFDLFHLGAV